MQTRSSLAIRVGATFLLIMVAAACGSGATSAPAGEPTGAPGATGAVVAGATVASATVASATVAGATDPGQPQGGGAGSVNDGLGHPVNVCNLLPLATVASITGAPRTVAPEDAPLAIKTYVCAYPSGTGTSAVRITVQAMDAATGYDSSLQAAGSGAKQISGLGDKANSSILGVAALFGNVSITVSDMVPDAAAETLIRTLQPKL